MQNGSDVNRPTKDKMMSQRDQDVQEYQQIQNDIYNELMNPNLGVQFLLFRVFVVLVIAIPIQVLTDQLIKSQNSLDLFRISIPFEVLYFVIPLLSIIVIGYFNIKFVSTFSDRLQLFEEIQVKLKEAGKEQTQTLTVTETQHYKLIIRIETAFVIGTFFVACLWFLVPSQGRLEPLTIIYGFGTAIFEYFRTKLGIPNPLDRFIANR